jgi:hypothetical protein
MTTLKYQNESEDLQKVTVRLLEDGEVERFNKLFHQHHYLANARYAGQSMRYVAEIEGTWLALLCFSAPSLNIKAREGWIGWSPRQRARRLGFVVNNSRFLILPDRGTFPNLASRVLALCLRRLSEDWISRWGHPVLIVETYVAGDREGTCYRACGFEEVGMTAGYGRVSGVFYEQHNEPKRVYLRELKNKARKILKRAKLPNEFRAYEAAISGPCPFHVMELNSLLMLFRSLKDSRRGHGLQHRMHYVIACAAVAVLMGAAGYKAIEDTCKKFTQPQLKALGAKRGKEGRCLVPSDSTFYRVLNKLNVAEFERIIFSWIGELEISVLLRLAIDGKVLRGSSRADGKPLQLLSAVTHNLRITIGQIPINEKSNEIPAFWELLKRVSPQPGTLITADAMHCQKKSARMVTEEYNCDYVFGLKENQSTIFEYASLLLKQEAFPP